MRRPIKIQPNVIDAATGKDISEITEVTVLYNGTWVPLEEVPSEKMLSGTVWKYRFRAEGYEDELFLTAKLSPKN